ncbi:MAG: PKD domain-containing protein [Nitrospiraceae bacterium]|nr:PKD domain-containing protein [Nitrospiraceae bacterium]
MPHVVSERSERTFEERRRRALIGLLILLPLFLILATAARAQEMQCTDCHGITGPHATQCRDTSCSTACHAGKLDAILHPSGAGTPMTDVTSSAGITAACNACHERPGATHPYRINTNPSATSVYPGLDSVCGQCHGGGTNSITNPPQFGVVYFTAGQLAVAAPRIHYADGMNAADCTACHNGAQPLNHPTGAETPGIGAAACRLCHLANGTLHHHLAGVTPAINVDSVCGQCHGGDTGAAKNGAPQFDTATLANWSKDMHKIEFGSVDKYPAPNFSWTVSATTSYLVSFDAGSTVCPAGEMCSSYVWDFGDGTAASGMSLSHLFTMPTATATFNVKLTVTVDGFTSGKSITKAVSPVFVNHDPTASGLMAGTTSTNPAIVTNATNNVTFVDASSDPDGNIQSVSVNWGDGTVDTQPSPGGVFSHNYTRAMRYAIIHAVRDSGGKSAFEKAYVKIVPPRYEVSGTVRNGSGEVLSGVFVALKLNGRTRSSKMTTSLSPNFRFAPQLPGSYTVKPYKNGCTFSDPGIVDVVSENVTVDITATCP